MDIYKEIVRERDAGHPCALVSVTAQSGSTPSATSAKMLVKSDGSTVGTVGGGAAEGKAIEAAREAIASGQSKSLDFNLTENPVFDLGMVCGGHMQFQIEAILPNRRVYLFGGGHVGLVTERLCRMIGLETVVIDDRPEFANAERFPEAAATRSGPLEEATADLKPNAASLVFIATRGHAFDQEALAWALSTPADYIGMIGSRRKVFTVYKNLIAAGIDASAFARVRAPVGLELGAEGPEEIAISVVAEMIGHLRGSAGVQSLTRTMDGCAGGKEAKVLAVAD